MHPWRPLDESSCFSSGADRHTQRLISMFNGWPVSPSISRASQRQQRPRTNQVKSPRRPALKNHSQKSAAQKVENDTRLGLILLTPFTNLPRATLKVTPRHPRSYSATLSKLPRVTLELTPRHSRSYSASLSKLLRAALEVAPTCPQICSGISHYQAFAGILSHSAFSPTKQSIPSRDNFVTSSLCACGRGGTLCSSGT
jgi:hypothetical protein